VEERPKGAVLNVPNIRIAMAIKGWSQTKLAEEAGVSRTTVNDALRSWRVGIDAALAITKVLDLTPNQSLVGWKDPDDNEENLADAPMSEGAVTA